MFETQGKACEEWVKGFANQYHILSKKQFSPEKLVKLLDTKVQRRFVAARSYVEKELPYSDIWIDLILNNKRLPQQVDEQVKTALVEKFLDYALATDVLLTVKTNQGKDCLIAVDVTANPKKEQQKLNTIQGRREDGDPTRFNRNQNLPDVVKQLGMQKQGVLVLNNFQPPSHEQLLNEIYAFANSPARTRAINLFSSVPEKSRSQQQATIFNQTPQQLWQKYNQGITTASPIERQVEITKKALQDGLAEKLPDILAHDPFVQKVQREQGTQQARKHITTIIDAVVRKERASQQSQQSPQKGPGRDRGPEL